MFPLIETAIAFIVLMLAASLFVSAMVQILVNAGRYRSRTLVDMLRSLMHGFRVFHNDPRVVDAQTGRADLDDDGPEFEFVKYVLRDPVLHARGQTIAYQADDERLSQMVEYIDEDDLVALAYNAAKSPGQTALGATEVAAMKDPSHVRSVEGAESDLLLPDAWVRRDRSNPAATSYATTANFAAYVGRWFNTIEGTATQQFKRQIRHLTLIVSMTTVVLLNIDGVQVLRELYRNGAARAAVAAQAREVQTVATRLGVLGAPAATDLPVDQASTSYSDLGLELEKTGTLLGEAGIGIGWQDSWITRRWCSYRGQCALGDAPPTRSMLIRDTLLWMFGLAFSCVMLSLGAPFWVTTLSRLINMKNEVQSRKEKETAPTERKLKSAEEISARVAEHQKAWLAREESNLEPRVPEGK